VKSKADHCNDSCCGTIDEASVGNCNVDCCDSMKPEEVEKSKGEMEPGIHWLMHLT
jgi:hypothetical protein